MNPVIPFPNGEAIRADHITAVRKGDKHVDKGIPGIIKGYTLEERIIVDFECGGHGNNLIIPCPSRELRDLGAAMLVALWQSKLQDPYFAWATLIERIKEGFKPSRHERLSCDHCHY